MIARGQVYHYFQMNVRQLQGLVAQCKAIQEKIEATLARSRQQSSEAELLQQTIKQTRFEVIELQYQLKSRAKKSGMYSQYDRQIHQLEKDISNTTSINIKIKEQWQQLVALGSNLRKKINHTQEKISQCERQIQLAEKYQEQSKMGEALDQMYWDKRTQLESIIIQGRDQKDNFQRLCKLKREEFMMKGAEIQRLDQNYADLDEATMVQKEIIKNILSNEQGDKTKEDKLLEKEEVDPSEIQIMNGEQGRYFQQTEDLNPLQKAELQSIVHKKQFAQQQQRAKIGKIRNQQSHLNYLGRIVRFNQRSKINSTEASYLKGSQIQTSQLVRSQQLYKSRLDSLQKKKRVRTRQTELHRFLQQYKNRVSDEAAVSSIQKVQADKSNKSILQVYQQLKNNEKVRHRTVGNIEIIKLMKKHRKRKVQTGARGTSFECENESLM